MATGGSGNDVVNVDEELPQYARLFKEELENPNGLERLNQIRTKLGPRGQRLKLECDPLGKKKKVFLVYPMGSPREQGVVVKFNPLTDLDPYIDDAHKEYRILTKLRDLPSTAPQPLFRSSDVEESIVGTAFFAMTYIHGRIFRTIGEIPRGKVIELHEVAMRKLAEVHRVELRSRDLVAQHKDTQSYWKETIDSCKNYFKKAVGWWTWYFWWPKESSIFSQMSRGRKPSTTQRVSVVHGNLDIGNFVFNKELTEVLAILNWKYERNGDPLIDVASLLQVFLDLGSYSISKPSSLVFHAADADVDRVVAAYRQQASKGFNQEELQFAQAACCLKQISVIKRGAADKFRGHDLRHFKEITDNPDMVIDLLRGHAEAKYRAFIS